MRDFLRRRAAPPVVAVVAVDGVTVEDDDACAAVGRDGCSNTKKTVNTNVNIERVDEELSTHQRQT